jgi:hypothetical protein
LFLFFFYGKVFAVSNSFCSAVSAAKMNYFLPSAGQGAEDAQTTMIAGRHNMTAQDRPRCAGQQKNAGNIVINRFSRCNRVGFACFFPGVAVFPAGNQRPAGGVSQKPPAGNSIDRR